jgi:hypothetical protein
MNMIRDLGDQARLPSNHTEFKTLFKSMAFQQFWLQRRISAADLGRQIPLFLELKNKETISELFHQASRGLSLHDFFELSFGVVAHFLSNDKPLVLRPTYFNPISDQYPPDSIPRFLDLVALDRSQAQAFLKAEDSRVRDFDARLYERTPLTKRPLLTLSNGTLLCYAPQVLFHGFGNLVYDLLKDHSPSKFSEHFGYAFEEYIKIALKHLSIPFISESELKSTFPNSLVVDYLVPLHSVNILIEAKAVELSPQARTTPSPTVVLNHLRSSVLKAIKQGLTTAHRIRTNDSNIAREALRK